MAIYLGEAVQKDGQGWSHQEAELFGQRVNELLARDPGCKTTLVERHRYRECRRRFTFDSFPRRGRAA